MSLRRRPSGVPGSETNREYSPARHPWGDLYLSIWMPWNYAERLTAAADAAAAAEHPATKPLAQAH